MYLNTEAAVVADTDGTKCSSPNASSSHMLLSPSCSSKTLLLVACYSHSCCCWLFYTFLNIESCYKRCFYFHLVPITKIKFNVLPSPDVESGHWPWKHYFAKYSFSRISNVNQGQPTGFHFLINWVSFHCVKITIQTGCDNYGNMCFWHSCGIRHQDESEIRKHTIDANLNVKLIKDWIKNRWERSILKHIVLKKWPSAFVLGNNTYFKVCNKAETCIIAAKR